MGYDAVEHRQSLQDSLLTRVVSTVQVYLRQSVLSSGHKSVDLRGAQIGSPRPALEWEQRVRA